MTVSKYDLPEDIRLKLESFIEEHGILQYWIEVKPVIFCGKSRCLKCRVQKKGHEGPFYYVHYRDGNGKLRTKYLGKPKSQQVSYETPRKLRKTDEASLCEECEWFEDNRCSWQENAAIFTCHFQPKKKDNCSQIPGLKPSKIKVTPQEAIVNSLILEARKKMTRGQIYHKHKD
ncbi:hypothetical protein DRO69_00250 [Candidatus Bathyarchaeota archaeon]|nr:MAG: hypothetical protein DRO69_00250 [Candidatus Bathyarchaeota archaeon]